MTSRRVWHLWPARNWPASAREEAAFVVAMTVLAAADLRPRPRTPSAHPHRPDITAVLNALRCGLTAAELTALIPGTPPAALLAAHTHLQDRLDTSRNAWDTLVADPSWETVQAKARDASLLLPVPVYRIMTVSAHTGTRRLAGVIAELQDQIDDHVRLGKAIEDELATRRPPNPGAVALAARLHDPVEPALWGSPYFLPTRVTQLSPPRVADLLEERGSNP